MELLAEVLPIVINILLIVLITVGIILGIKCIYVVDKTKKIMDNVEEKVNSLNALFAIVSLINNKVALITDKAVAVVEEWLSKLFRKRSDDEDEHE